MVQDATVNLWVSIFQILGSCATAGALFYSLYTFRRARRSDQVKLFAESVESFFSAYPRTSITWSNEPSRMNKQVEYSIYLNKGESLALLRSTKEIKDKDLIEEIDRQIKSVYKYFVITLPLFTAEEFKISFPQMTKIYENSVSKEPANRVGG